MAAVVAAAAAAAAVVAVVAASGGSGGGSSSTGTGTPATAPATVPAKTPAAVPATALATALAGYRWVYTALAMRATGALFLLAIQKWHMHVGALRTRRQVLYSQSTNNPQCFVWTRPSVVHERPVCRA